MEAVTKLKTGLPTVGKLPIGNAAQVVAAAPGRHKVAGVEGLAGHDPLRAEELARLEKEATEKKRAVEAKKVTFAQAAKDFLEARAPTWKGRYARAQSWNPVKDYALPLIGDLLIDDIGVAHVVAVLKKVQDAPRKSDDDGKETARRMRAKIEAVCNAAGALGQRDLTRQNPAGAELIKHVHPLKRKGERDHYRRIEELDGAPRAFREILEHAESDTRFAAWAFMILTAARPSEALKARWSEIDLALKLWSIPAGRMKGAVKHVVPLSAAVVEILKRQETVSSSDAVFPGQERSAAELQPVRHRGEGRGHAAQLARHPR